MQAGLSANRSGSEARSAMLEGSSREEVAGKECFVYSIAKHFIAFHSAHSNHPLKITFSHSLTYPAVPICMAYKSHVCSWCPRRQHTKAQNFKPDKGSAPLKTTSIREEATVLTR